mgnify:CR=1 FL=1
METAFAMIRTKGEPGTGDVVQAVRHMRMMQSEIRKVVSMDLALVDIINFDRLQDLRFGNVTDATLRHNGDGRIWRRC